MKIHGFFSKSPFLLELTKNEPKSALSYEGVKFCFNGLIRFLSVPIYCHNSSANFYLCFAVNKQINDKERVAAAMENPNLREIVEQCVLEPD